MPGSGSFAASFLQTATPLGFLVHRAQENHIQALLVFFYKSYADRGINASQVWPCAFLAHPPNAGNYSDNKYCCACCGGVLQLPLSCCSKLLTQRERITATS